MAKHDSSSISFTAYYTGEVWRQHGLSHTAFATNTGKYLYHIGQPFEKTARLLAGASIQTTLLQRHHLIDHVLRHAIEHHGVTQVIEIACGLSPRGTQFCQDYPNLHYIEADLPEMAQHKQQLLENHQLLSERHRVVAIDILATTGSLSLDQVFAQHTDRRRNTLVITEGLVNYFELSVISGFWTRLALALKGFPKGGYTTDLYPNFTWHPMVKLVNTFVHGLAFATKSHVSLHFEHQQAIIDGFLACGFAQTQVHIPEAYYDQLPIPTQRIASLVRVVESWV
ncbi:MAG: class I SAM-dependent methyltransferase [Pseudomonadota bacterium]|nr:class I SAM-dependent methyltransferase [Pseudomonadota bacterium]